MRDTGYAGCMDDDRLHLISDDDDERQAREREMELAVASEVCVYKLDPDTGERVLVRTEPAYDRDTLRALVRKPKWGDRR